MKLLRIRIKFDNKHGKAAYGRERERKREKTGEIKYNFSNREFV